MFNQPYPQGSRRGMPQQQAPWMPNQMGQGQDPSRNPSPLAAIPVIREMMTKGPDAMYQQMYQSNPQFRQFADSMSGKTPQEAFAEYGYDFNQIQQMMNGMR